DPAHTSVESVDTCHPGAELEPVECAASSDVRWADSPHSRGARGSGTRHPRPAEGPLERAWGRLVEGVRGALDAERSCEAGRSRAPLVRQSHGVGRWFSVDVANSPFRV